MYIDSTEITNAKWDEIIQWANDNAGYTGLSLKGGDPDAPVTGISIGRQLNGVTQDLKRMDLLPLIMLMHLKRLLILMGMEL